MRVPKKPSGRKALPFYWYRRFKAHKPLPYKASLLDKIENVSDLKKIKIDQEKKEENKVIKFNKLVNGLYRLFKVSKDIIREEMNEFDGTTKEFYYHIAKL